MFPRIEARVDDPRTVTYSLAHDLRCRWAGSCAIFECVGIHAALHGTRHEALEPIRQGVAERLGSVEEDAARSLAVRHDHGSQYMSRDFQREITWLGATSSPAFIRAPFRRRAY